MSTETTWTKVPPKQTGVSVFASSGGRFDYTTATRFEDDRGALYVLKGDEVKAVHAAGRWESAVVHQAPAESPAEGATVTLTAATVRALAEQVSR